MEARKETQKEIEERNLRTNRSEMDSTTKTLVVVFIIVFFVAILIYKFW